MSSVKVFISFAILVGIFTSVSIIGINSAKRAEADKHEAQIEVLELEKNRAKQDAKLSELAADEAVKRAETAHNETDKIKARLAKELETVKVETINGIEYVPISIPETQTVLIISLENELAETQKALKLTQTALSDTKRALQASENQLIEARFAIEAHKAASKSSRWTGRIEGFGIGIGTGLLANVIK